jgi:ribosomal protein L37E
MSTIYQPTLFIPAAEIALCADCGGAFYVVGRQTCPGCGSSSWILRSHADALARENVDRLEAELAQATKARQRRAKSAA